MTTKKKVIISSTLTGSLILGFLLFGYMLSNGNYSSSRSYLLLAASVLISVAQIGLVVRMRRFWKLVPAAGILLALLSVLYYDFVIGFL